MSNPDQRSGSTSMAPPPRRRRPVWAWLLLALVAIAIVIAILLLTGRCGSDSTAGAPPATPSAGAPAGAAVPPGAPGAGTAAPPSGTPATGAANGSGSSTAPGAPTDAAALQSSIDQIVAAAPITFRPNSAELTDSGAASLARVAEELAAVPTARVVITGYAAPAGTSGTPNPQQLSEQRATTVAGELADDGVAPDRMQTRGAADTNPRPDLAASRRAEITVS
jgi:outer membrane protein OmpA-like peptidoglycan-associated protein